MKALVEILDDDQLVFLKPSSLPPRRGFAIQGSVFWKDGEVHGFLEPTPARAAVVMAMKPRNTDLYVEVRYVPTREALKAAA